MTNKWWHNLIKQAPGGDHIPVEKELDNKHILNYYKATSQWDLEVNLLPRIDLPWS